MVFVIKTRECKVRVEGLRCWVQGPLPFYVKDKLLASLISIVRVQIAPQVQVD